MWFVCIFFPLQDKPEHQGGEHGRVGVNLTFDSRKPKRIAPGVGQCTGESAAHHQDELRPRADHAIGADKFACQMCDAPKEEQNAEGREQGRHDVHHERHLRGVTCKLAEEVARQHEERCTGRMAHFKLVCRCDELGAVPKTRRRLHRHAVGESCDGECEPTQQVVYEFVLFHKIFEIVC